MKYTIQTVKGNNITARGDEVQLAINGVFVVLTDGRDIVAIVPSSNVVNAILEQ